MSRNKKRFYRLFLKACTNQSPPARWFRGPPPPPSRRCISALEWRGASLRTWATCPLPSWPWPRRWQTSSGGRWPQASCHLWTTLHSGPPRSPAKETRGTPFIKRQRGWEITRGKVCVWLGSSWDELWWSRSNNYNDCVCLMWWCVEMNL